MIKTLHVDTVFEVFIFKFFNFGYSFYARRGTYRYLMMVNFLKTLEPPISGESSTKMSYLRPPHTNTRSYGIKRWNTMRKKKIFVVPPIPLWSRWSSDSCKLRGTVQVYRYLYRYHKLNKYFTGYPVFKILGYMYPVKVQTWGFFTCAPKSLLVGTPTTIKVVCVDNVFED